MTANKEIFKDIKDFEGLYQISNYGNVKSLSRIIKKGNGICQKVQSRILKPNLLKTGYCIVSLKKNNKRYAKTIHRLVAEAFIPNPCCYAQINHKNGVKVDNYVDNLEWCNESINIKHSYKNLKRKIHKFTKKVLCIDTGEVFKSIAEAGRMKNINWSCISHVLNNRARTAGGYKWKEIR